MRKPLGLILAGGQGRRMGHRPKADLRLGGARLLDLCADRLDPQVEGLVVNTNQPLRTTYPTVADPLPDFAGPLAGVLAGLIYAEDLGASHVVSVAVDTPFFPCDLVPLLQLAGLDHPLGFAVAGDSTGLHPTFALWPVALRAALSTALEEGTAKMRAFTAAHGAVTAPFPDTTPNGFFNINTPDDLTEAARWL